MLGKIKIRFKLAWQNYRVGDVIQPPGTLRQFLLSTGYCEVVPDPPVTKPQAKQTATTKSK